MYLINNAHLLQKSFSSLTLVKTALLFLMHLIFLTFLHFRTGCATPFAWLNLLLPSLFSAALSAPSYLPPSLSLLPRPIALALIASLSFFLHRFSASPSPRSLAPARLSQSLFLHLLYGMHASPLLR